jgi:hypothetical protein
LPQEEPAGQNPPDGAMIDYYLKEPATGEVTLSIKDSKGNTIRTFSSNDQPYSIPPVNIPLYWIRPQQLLSATAGAHRFLWDMHYTPLNTPPAYPISAVYGNTAPEPTAPWVMPGTYTVVLTVNGKAYTQSLTVAMDPRVKTSLKDLQDQHDYSLTCYNDRIKAAAYAEKIAGYKKTATNLTKETLQELNAFGGSVGRRRAASTDISFGSLTGGFDAVQHTLQEADMPPTEQAITAAKKLHDNFLQLEQKWLAFEKKNLKL